MVEIEKFCDDLQQCVGKNTYDTPETINIKKLQKGGYKIMCAGLVVAACEAQGSNVYNGSNTIWREYLSDCGYIIDGKPSQAYPHKVNGRKSSQLQKGMVVFKWKSHGCRKEAHEKDGKGNYVHIGVVTSVNPLRIVHASSETGDKPCVIADAKIGKWCAWGWLKCTKPASLIIEKDSVVKEVLTTEPQKVGDIMGGTLATTTTLNIRNSASTKAKIIGTIKKNTVTAFTGDPNGNSKENWVQIVHGNITGYICTNKDGRSYVDILSTYGDDIDENVHTDHTADDEEIVEADTTPEFDLMEQLDSAIAILNKIQYVLKNS